MPCRSFIDVYFSYCEMSHVYFENDKLQVLHNYALLATGCEIHVENMYNRCTMILKYAWPFIVLNAVASGCLHE